MNDPVRFIRFFGMLIYFLDLLLPRYFPIQKMKSPGSISAFKRDFKDIFNTTPSRWLMQKRLQEAHFLIEKKAQKPSDIFQDLGFETLSHFSFAFKKQFKTSPTDLLKQNEH